jgi:hypothetical protein
MIKKTIYHGTFYSDLVRPDYKGLLEKSLDWHFDAKAKDNKLDFKIDMSLIHIEFNGSKTFETLKSKSVFELHIENGVTINELYEVVKTAVDHLKNYDLVSPSDKQNYLDNIPYPPLSVFEEKLKEIQDWFRK